MVKNIHNWKLVLIFYLKKAFTEIYLLDKNLINKKAKFFKVDILNFKKENKNFIH